MRVPILRAPLDFSEDDLYRAIGERVRDARSGVGLTQEGLGEVVGLGRTSITNLEQGRQHISVMTLYRLASALGMNPADLLPIPSTEQVPALDSWPDLSPQERDWIRKIVSPAPNEAAT